ncbi:Predicted secreted Zn-dependent protease [Rhizobium sp. RU36D]|nr:Predicted secreted Zn-dependent protease [Rhizobium sp. RU36D]
MRRVPSMLPTIIALGIAATGFDEVAADTVLNKTITYFDISGHTADDLLKEILRHGPLIRPDGERHPGVTKTSFGGDYTSAESGGRCVVQSARVIVDAHIILPRWKDRELADERLGLAWDALSRESLLHEEHHVQIALMHGKALEKAILDLRPRRTCKELEDAKDVLAAQTLVNHDLDQRRFDLNESADFERLWINFWMSDWDQTHAK